MLRKQGKLQPWWRFGYVILIIIKFGELLLWFSPRIINSLRSFIKPSKGCFTRYPNTLKLVEKNSAAPRFFQLLLGVKISDKTLFLVFDILLENAFPTPYIVMFTFESSTFPRLQVYCSCSLELNAGIVERTVQQQSSEKNCYWYDCRNNTS